MMLVDSDIKKYHDGRHIIIEPWNEARLGSNSYDLTLGNKLLIYTNDVLDAKKEHEYKIITIAESGIQLVPGELYLGYTREYTETHKLIPQLEGKSSIGRLGISVHITAGFGDTGFKGH